MCLGQTLPLPVRVLFCKTLTMLVHTSHGAVVGIKLINPCKALKTVPNSLHYFYYWWCWCHFIALTKVGKYAMHFRSNSIKKGKLWKCGHSRANLVCEEQAGPGPHSLSCRITGGRST